MRNDGQLILAIGVARSGKSVLVKRIAEQQAERVLVFDPKGEYVHQLGFTACLSEQELLEQAKATTGAGKLAFIASSPAEFERFCQVAFTFNRQAPALIVCEELAAVTNTVKARGAWGRLVNQGLAFEPTIIATVQRGQEVDKSVMNNATYLHLCMHNTDDDAQYVAKKLGIALEQVPRQPLAFLQWRSGLGVVCQGQIDFHGKASGHWPDGTPRFFIGKQRCRLDGARFAEVNYDNVK